MVFGQYKKVSVWLVIILIIVSFVGGFLVGGNQFGNPKVIKGASVETPQKLGSVTNVDAVLPDYLTRDVDFGLFWDTWNLLREKYYKKDIPETQLFYGALQGMVAATGDPYTVFFTPKDAKDFSDAINGSFEGIGAEIELRKGRPTIAPLPDMPAIKAGLKLGDVILAIDGQDTESMSLDKAVGMIRGPKGTTVTLTILREGLSAPKDFKVVRAQITVKSVSWEVKSNDIGYIKIRQFNDDTVPLLNSAIVDFSQKDIKGLIIDLRNDPGGYLQAAVDVAGEWTKGQVVVSEKLRDGQSEEYRSNRPARLAGYKTVVLVNQGSASASEIVAGALKDWGRGTIVGMKTFGKGSVQELDTLKDGSSVKITIAKWFTPNGTSIDEQGIEPDVKIDLTEDDFNNNRDPQFDKAVSVLREMK